MRLSQIRAVLAPLTMVGGAVLVGVTLALSARLGTPARLTAVPLPVKSSIDSSYMRPRASAAVKATDRTRANEHWAFGPTLPPGWSLTPGMRVAARDRQLRIMTSPTTDIQVRSPILRLPPGTYRVLLRGAVLSGGLYIGAESMEQQRCETATYFDSGSTSKHRPWMPLDFTTDGEPLRLVLGNWVETPHHSVWSLSELRIIDRTRAVRAAAKAKSYSVQASPLVPASELVNFGKMVNWEFGYKIPSDWYMTKGVSATRSSSLPGQVIQTTRDRYGYVFVRFIRLTAGTYFLRFKGEILKGGLGVGAESLRTRTWIAQKSYWYGQTNSSGIMGVEFYVPHNEPVGLVVANWSIANAKSRWLINGLELDYLRG